MSHDDHEKQCDDDGDKAQWSHVIDAGGPVASEHVCHVPAPIGY